VSALRRENIVSAEAEVAAGRPEGYRDAVARLGPQIGATMIGASIYHLPPGVSSFPYHYEYGNEERLSSSPGGRPCAIPAARTRSSPATSSASRRAPRERTS
jgi:hypothetical protein